MPPRYEVIGIEGLPEIHLGDDLGRLITEAATAKGLL
jgi:F420-0:gamma-glutamyl ligase